MTTADKIPVLCTLARHHKGDHDVIQPPAKRPCGEVARYVERVAEEVCPPVEPEAMATFDSGEPPDPSGFADMREAAEVAEHGAHPSPPTPPVPVPAEPPALSDLIEAAEVADDWVTNARIEKERADVELGKAIASQERRRSAVAQRVGKGAIVDVGGALFRSVPPRKPKGGEVAADALWRLEPVEVKK